MQNDLISRSALMKEIEKSLKENPHSDAKVAGVHCHEHRHFMVMVATQPTAYSVESVVERLEEYSTLPITEDEECWILLDDAIEIVKAGGTDGQTN